MIKTAKYMLRALRKKRFTGVILYEGPSLLNGAPIVVIANRITDASSNAKTGAMVQSFMVLNCPTSILWNRLERPNQVALDPTRFLPC